MFVLSQTFCTDFQIQNWRKEVANGQTSHDIMVIIWDKSLGTGRESGSNDLNMSQEYVQLNLVQQDFWVVAITQSDELALKQVFRTRGQS